MSKKKKGDKHIDLTLSLGHVQENDDNDGLAPVDFNNIDNDQSLSSEYSEYIRQGDVRIKKSPQKISKLSESTQRRKQCAIVSGEHRSTTFVLVLYNNKNSPIYHGFTYENSLALMKP